jgi:hypothetical protein
MLIGLLIILAGSNSGIIECPDNKIISAAKPFYIFFYVPQADCFQMRPIAVKAFFGFL